MFSFEAVTESERTNDEDLVDEWVQVEGQFRVRLGSVMTGVAWESDK